MKTVSHLFEQIKLPNITKLTSPYNKVAAWLIFEVALDVAFMF